MSWLAILLSGSPLSPVSGYHTVTTSACGIVVARTVASSLHDAPAHFACRILLHLLAIQVIERSFTRCGDREECVDRHRDRSRNAYVPARVAAAPD